ncbi:hypothetical protein ACFZAR_36220 [Streptomyces sp. NPDC008222]|uniref:hypothetical protein n=1 Tax=Streptomyces sp. NPDC008222 TaxID=3364820 RepID=UPI0036EFFFA7
MSPLTATAATLTLLASGYAIGRLQPVRRACDWANWQKYSKPTGLRYAAVFVILSAENLTWLALHPVQGARAWEHRNDPPPPRSPAPTICDPVIPDHTVNEEQE